MKRPRRERDERGSITVFYLLAAVGMALVVGLALDLGSSVYAKQRAYDVATQAARAGGQAVVAEPAMLGEAISVDPTRGQAAAMAYITSAGLTGTVTVSTTTIDVTTTNSWTPVVLGQFGFGTQAFVGRASARLVRSVNGVEG